MRIFKFRAWNGKKLGYFKLSNICANGDYIYTDNGNEFDSDMPIMQYTGLKDKNGKEIYEGDILTYIDDFPFFCEVLWDNEGGQYYVKFADDGDTGSLSGFFGRGTIQFEIVGNIYENQDILKAG